eukprot:506946-Rhodomonas_salina.1
MGTQAIPLGRHLFTCAQTSALVKTGCGASQSLTSSSLHRKIHRKKEQDPNTDRQTLCRHPHARFLLTCLILTDRTMFLFAPQNCAGTNGAAR